MKPCRYLLVWSLIFLSGCGSDPVRRDLEAYRLKVLAPTLEDFDPGSQAVEGKRSAAQLAAHCEEWLLPRYRALWQRATRYTPATTELAELNGQLRDTSQSLCHLVHDYATALRQKNVPEQDRLDAQLASIDLAGLLARIDRLCIHHHIATN